MEDEAQSLFVSPTFTVAPTSAWRLAGEWDIGYDWFRRDCDDSHWRVYHAPDAIPCEKKVAFRTWFEVADVSSITGVEMKLKHAGWIHIYLNEEECLHSWVYADKAWMTLTIPASYVVQGRNLVALTIERRYSHDRSEVSQEAADSSQFLHCVLRLMYETERAARSIDAKVTGDFVAPHAPENLMSNSLTNFWMADFASQAITVTFSFLMNSHHTVNKYCITNGAASSAYDPSRWSLQFKIDKKEQSMVTVDQQRYVLWGARLQTQCFILPVTYDRIISVFWKVESLRAQRTVQATRLTFFSVNVNAVKTKPFEYAVKEIGVFENMPIRTECPSFAYFAHFSISPDLPRGLVLNQGTGCLSGTVRSRFQSAEYTLSATSITNEEVTTVLYIHHEACVYPNAELSISLRTASSPLSVEISLFSASWEVVRSSLFFLTDKTQTFFHCLPPERFFLLLADDSAQGDLTSSWFVKQNQFLLSKGVFNPGFPQQWSSLIVKETVDENNTLWYYCVNGKEPPRDWFKQIDPPKEPWQTALLKDVPVFSGVAQYFKTVLVLPPLDSIHTVAVYTRIQAGVVLYANGREVSRFNLPDGALTASTLATSSFAEPTVYAFHIPVQFSALVEGRNVLAVETHSDSRPTHPTPNLLRVNVQYHPERSGALLGARVVDLSAERGEEGVSLVNDGIYYNHYFRNSNCVNQSIAFFTANGEPDFASSFDFFVGESKGAYPHRMTLFGRFLGSVREIGMAKRGEVVENREWVKLYEGDEIEFHNVHYGIHKEVHFYNKQMFNEYLFVFNDCEKANGFEIAEVSFRKASVSGFCDSHDLFDPMPLSEDDYSSFIASNTWFKVACNELYTGSILHFCNSGNWTKTVNHCHCKAPFYFKYPSPVVYVSLRHHISIVPKWKGADLHFFSSSILPSALSLNEQTGEISGEIREPISLMTLTIRCGNFEGYIDATVSIMTVNNHEALLIMTAAVMVVVFVAMLWLITVSMKRKRNEDAETMEMSVLHMDGLSEEMRSFLL